jgi:hypothetical protein
VSSFISNALRRFPPAPDRKYMLVFWDHGSGWEGFGGHRAAWLAVPCRALHALLCSGSISGWQRAARARLRL